MINILNIVWIIIPPDTALRCLLMEPMPPDRFSWTWKSSVLTIILVRPQRWQLMILTVTLLMIMMDHYHWWWSPSTDQAIFTNGVTLLVPPPFSGLQAGTGEDESESGEPKNWNLSKSESGEQKKLKPGWKWKWWAKKLKPGWKWKSLTESAQIRIFF